MKTKPELNLFKITALCVAIINVSPHSAVEHCLQLAWRTSSWRYSQ